MDEKFRKKRLVLLIDYAVIHQHAVVIATALNDNIHALQHAVLVTAQTRGGLLQLPEGGHYEDGVRTQDTNHHG
jgi:hypothetical protein